MMYSSRRKPENYRGEGTNFKTDFFWRIQNASFSTGFITVNKKIECNVTNRGTHEHEEVHYRHLSLRF